MHSCHPAVVNRLYFDSAVLTAVFVQRFGVSISTVIPQCCISSVFFGYSPVNLNNAIIGRRLYDNGICFGTAFLLESIPSTPLNGSLRN